MGSSGLAALLRGVLLLGAGAAFALALRHGLYASALVAALAGLWGVATGIAAARRPAIPVLAAPPPAPDPARRERRLTALLDLSPAPIVTLEGADRLHAINRAARRLFAAQDLIPDPPAEVIGAIGRDQAHRGATVMISGRSYAIITTDFVLGGAQSRLAALIDIDAELKAAEASTLRDLVQVLSHEIVNALTPIASLSRSAVDMLDDDPPSLPALRDAIGTVARRAAGLQRFGEAYRALARLPVPILQRIEVEQVIADLARLFMTRWPDIELVVEATPPCRFNADPDQLSAALWAVLQNAAEAGGRVALRVDADAGALRFAISDDGPGIAAADATEIFKPFFTTKPNGSGVGLALARQIFLAHGGDLVLVSHPPDVRGAHFEARLPLTGAPLLSAA